MTEDLKIRGFLQVLGHSFRINERAGNMSVHSCLKRRHFLRVAYVS